MIEPTSVVQLEAFDAGGVPQLEQVREGIWALGMSAGERPATLCYLIADLDGRLHVIDPGMRAPENLKRLLEAVRRLGFAPDDIVSVVVSHLHDDHLGLASDLRERFGTRIVMHDREQQSLRGGRERIGQWLEVWGVPAERVGELLAVDKRRADQHRVEADILIRDGDKLLIPGRLCEVIWTPGHTYGHICIRITDEHLLLTGDHVLPVITPGVGLSGGSPTNPIADYLRSLARIEGLGDEVAPGHGYRFLGLGERCARLRAKVRSRAGDVEEAARAAGADATIWEIARRVPWASGFENLRANRLANALNQTALYWEYIQGNQCE